MAGLIGICRPKAAAGQEEIDSPRYRTYMKECTVLGVGRYNRTCSDGATGGNFQSEECLLDCSFSLRVSQLANGTGTFRRHLAKKNSRTLDHVLAAKSVYLSLAHVAW